MNNDHNDILIQLSNLKKELDRLTLLILSYNISFELLEYKVGVK